MRRPALVAACLRRFLLGDGHRRASVANIRAALGALYDGSLDRTPALFLSIRRSLACVAPRRLAVAHEITKEYGATVVLDGALARPSRRAHGSASSGRTAAASRRFCASSPAWTSLRRPRRARRHGRLPAAGAGARHGETLLGYLARRTGVARRGAEALSGAAEDEELADAYPTRSTAFSRSAAGISRPRARGRSGARPRPARAGAADALRRRGRARLARRLLLARFDVFCLDEPTNDLDFDGLERLERSWTGFAAALVLVSHDRAFLDRTVTRIVAFEAETRRRASSPEPTRTTSRRERARAEHGGVRRLRGGARTLRANCLARVRA